MRVKIFLLAAFLVISSPAFALDCVVTSSANSGPGTLRELLKLKNGCTKITFDTAQMDSMIINVDSPITFEVSNATVSGWLYGWDQGSMDAMYVVLVGSSKLAAGSPVMSVTGQNNIITGLGFEHTDGLDLRIMSSGNTVKYNVFQDSKTGILVYSGKNNTLMHNTFFNFSGNEIEFKFNGNNNLQPPTEFDAKMLNSGAWALIGGVGENIVMAEPYVVHGDDSYKWLTSMEPTKEIVNINELFEGITEFPEDIFGGGIVFGRVTIFEEYSPTNSYKVLVTDSNGSTSTFSEAVKPVELESFFEDFPACGEAAWFNDEKEGVWNGDYDNDGIENGIEDTNKDCTPDKNETDPANADSDGDGRCDGMAFDGGVSCVPSDNCPLVSNTDQSDVNSDGVGDVCGVDADGDGVLNVYDNCPLVSNADQLDTDADVTGDACDNDKDNDGVANDSDNCPLKSNADQSDADSDKIGAVCDDSDALPEITVVPPEGEEPGGTEEDTLTENPPPEESTSGGEPEGGSGGCSLIR